VVCSVNNLNALSLMDAEIINSMSIYTSGHVTLTMLISGTAQKAFLCNVKAKRCSKSGEDRSNTEVTILCTDRQSLDGHMDSRWCYILSNAMHSTGETRKWIITHVLENESSSAVDHANNGQTRQHTNKLHRVLIELEHQLLGVQNWTNKLTLRRAETWQSATSQCTRSK